MLTRKSDTPVLKGLSFEVSDLRALLEWSENNNLRMVVHLDYGSAVEQYEEVLAFYSGADPERRWIMWRGSRSIIVEPALGQRRRYRSVATATKGFPHSIGPDVGATPCPSPSSLSLSQEE
jgi:hypothetical protein